MFARSRSVAATSVTLLALGLAGLAGASCGGDEGTLGGAPSVGDDDPSGGGGGASSGGGGGRPGADGGPVDAGPTHGFRADWFDQFHDLVLTRVEPRAGFAATEAAPIPEVEGSFYSARWTASVDVDRAGTWVFHTTSDDGVRVFVDDKPVIDNWTNHFAADDEGRVELPAGPHDVRVEYYQWDLGATLELTWGLAGEPLAPIPTERATPRSTPPAGENAKPLPGPRPTFTNPVVPFDCPDPGVMKTAEPRSRFTMVCTGGAYPIRESRNLVAWKDSGKVVLPGGKAAWSANGGRNWAPETHKVGDKYVVYFTAVDGSNRLAIGAASGPSPTGPFTDRGGPLVTHPVGVIDANFFEDDDGKRYLYWKVDGNQNPGGRTPILVRELAADGLNFAAGSSATEVLNNDARTWEGGVVEATWVVKRNGQYYMFYSGNVYDNRYRTGVARGPSPRGPFTKKGAPILTNNARWVGPGHGSVVVAHGVDYFFFHAWPALANGAHDTSKGRHGLLAPIRWVNGWPEFAGGSAPTGPLPFP